MKKFQVIIWISISLLFSPLVHSNCLVDFKVLEDLIQESYGDSYLVPLENLTTSEQVKSYGWTVNDIEYKDWHPQVTANAGINEICFEMQTADGCWDMKCKSFFIESKNASTTTYLENGPYHEYLDFNTLSFKGNTNWNDITWHFGNGESKAGNNITYEYPDVGEYTVTVIYYNSWGDCDEKSFSISILEPFNDFSYVQEGSLIIISNESVAFEDDFSWSFGEGGFSYDTNPTYQYEDYGTYTVCLGQPNSKQYPIVCKEVVYEEVDCIAEVVFELDQNFLQVYNLNELYKEKGFHTIDFGDGTVIENDVEISKHWYKASGIYECCLVFETDFGCKQNYCETIEVVSNNELEFYYEINGPLVKFTNLMSEADLAEVESFQWIFGDGSKHFSSSSNFNDDLLKSIEHFYYDKEIYNVSLSVFLKDGSFLSATKTLDLPLWNQQVYKLNFIYKANGPKVQFVNKSTIEENTIKYFWELGDGNISLDLDPVHEYKGSGKYTVRFCQILETGRMISAKKVVQIDDYCFADFNYSISPGMMITFKSIAVASIEISEVWYYNDDQEASGNSFSFQIPSDLDQMEVCLRIRNEFGCDEMICKNIEIEPSVEQAPDELKATLAGYEEEKPNIKGPDTEDDEDDAGKTSLVPEQQKLELKLMANPVMNQLRLSLKGVDEVLPMNIYNLNGQVLLNTQIQSQANIDVSNLPSGTYLIRVLDARFNETIKFQKL